MRSHRLALDIYRVLFVHCADTFAKRRIERIDDCGLLVADHPHFPEIDTERGQIFRDIANVLVLGAAR